MRPCLKEQLGAASVDTNVRIEIGLTAAAQHASLAAAVAPGTRLGKYEILKRLATGGMAEIFLVHSTSMPGIEKLLVLKRVLPHLAWFRFCGERRMIKSAQRRPAGSSRHA